MIKQHRGLQKDLGEVAKDLEDKSPDTGDIHKFLDKFAKDLKEHLDLENGVFYVDLLKKMKEAGQDTQKTEKFIAEMKEIEKVVIAFLEKYKDSKYIGDNIGEFKTEFANIVETLNLRIESEEIGVYAYWGLF